MKKQDNSINSCIPLPPHWPGTSDEGGTAQERLAAFVLKLHGLDFCSNPSSKPDLGPLYKIHLDTVWTFAIIFTSLIVFKFMNMSCALKSDLSHIWDIEDLPLFI